MQKIRYEVDPHNRLVAEWPGPEGGLPKFRRTIDGFFNVDENNGLSYHVKSPLTETEFIPHQLRLRGEWSLTEDHDLRLTLDKEGRKTFGDQITLQGEILDVDKNSLLFAVTTKTKDGQSIYVLNLGGSWKADENNRLSFHVKKEKGDYDILTFTGVWQIGKDHQIVYQCEKARFLVKKRRTHALVFKGRWDIKDKLRISYVLSEDTDSIFDFEAKAGLFKKDYIQYEVGIGLSGRAQPARRTVKLSGRWNFKRDVGLVFEIGLANRRKQTMVFGADARLTDRDTVSLRLKRGADNRDMGVYLELSHKLLKGDGEAFLRLLKSRGESAIYAGAAWQW